MAPAESIVTSPLIATLPKSVPSDMSMCPAVAADKLSSIKSIFVAVTASADIVVTPAPVIVRSPETATLPKSTPSEIKRSPALEANVLSSIKLILAAVTESLANVTVPSSLNSKSPLLSIANTLFAAGDVVAVTSAGVIAKLANSKPLAPELTFNI